MLKKFLLIFCVFLFCTYSVDIKSASNISELYGEPTQIGVITDPSIAEISGIAPSRTAKGLWWVHNDSGDKARLYVVNSGGKLLGRYTVTGARNRDWEDMAGFTAQKRLYIADFGDNELKRDDLTLYRVKEPDLSKGISDGATEPAEVFPFRYPDGRHNAEALFVDPKTGRPYIVAKTMSPPGGVYRFPMPLRPNVIVTLEKMTGAAVDRISSLLMVTGAAASPNGDRVVVRTYLGAFEITRVAGGSFETIFKSTPQSIKLPREQQGEAISYTLDGKSLVTTSEKVPAPIFKINRNH